MVRQIEAASEKANACFKDACDHSDLVQWMAGLPLTRLPELQEVVEELPDQLDEEGLVSALRAAIRRDWKKVSDEQVDETVYGKDHPKVAIRANNLGMVLQDLGNLSGAKAQFERALGVFEQNHPNVATLVNNLGLVLKGLGDLDDFVGMTIEEARGVVIGDVFFLHLIQKQ